MKPFHSIFCLVLTCMSASAAPVVLYETGWEAAPANPAWTPGTVSPQNGWLGGATDRHSVVADGSANAIAYGVPYTTPYGSQFHRFRASSSTTTTNGAWTWPDVTAAFAARPANYDLVTASIDVLVPAGGAADTSWYGLFGYDDAADGSGNFLDYGILMEPNGRRFLLIIDGVVVTTLPAAFPYDTWFNLAIKVNYVTGDTVVLTNGVEVPGLAANGPFIIGSTLTDVDLFCQNFPTAPAGRIVYTDNYRVTVESTITGPPGNDNFADAFVLAGSSGQTNGATSAATAEVNEPEHAALAPTASVWYRWTAPASRSFTFDTLNSSLNTVLAVYTGSALDGLTEVVASDDVGGGIVQSRATFQATAGVTYRIAVDSTGGTGNFTLRWRPTIQLAASVQPDNHLRLTITSAVPGFVLLQESNDISNPANWATFDSVEFTSPAGGTVDYDTGDLNSPARRFFRATQ